MPSEARLWKALRILNKEGARFRRQAAVGRLVYDFGDFSAHLLIELDGGVHQRLPDVALRDAEKTTWAEANGYRLMRITNDQVWGSLDATVAAIRSAISAPHPLPPPHKGEGES